MSEHDRSETFNLALFRRTGELGLLGVSEVLAMQTRAVRDGDVYVLDGCKAFITNGGVDEKELGDVFVV